MSITPGASVEDGGTRFNVWASKQKTLELHLLSPHDQIVPLRRIGSSGTFEAFVPEIAAGALYKYRFADGREFPDPASRYQPDGVHGASAVVADDFGWGDSAWRGVPLDRYIIYELHIGTFTTEGTFDSAIRELPRLVDLGITAVEVMPIAQFPGDRNWGYDGAYPGAVQNSYGGPEAFKRFVDAAHQHNLAVVLDVVYNHLGPEGNYFGEYAGYFTAKYKTPWGLALNFDGPESDRVREYFIANALMWFEKYHVDALRLDAIHAIIDLSAYPFLAELAERVHATAAESGREWYLIAESDLNDPKVIRPGSEGGYEHDAQWSDDFHHSIHTLLTGEKEGYYADFGGIEEFGEVMRSGYAYKGNYSRYRERRFGADPGFQDGSRFVVCSQNHDQVGNRMLGDRLTTLVSVEGLRLAAAAVLLSPFLPMLFMGEEIAEPAPFLYFTSHSDPALVEAVRNGRREEFSSFAWQGETPDPDARETFERSRIGVQSSPHRTAIETLYKELTRIRREHPAFRSLAQERKVATSKWGKAMGVLRGDGAEASLLLLNFGEVDETVSVPDEALGLHLIISSEDPRWSTEARTLDSELRTTAVTLPGKSYAFYAAQPLSRV